ncbi:DUF6312 domain-containing protein [Marinivivus vitaminiproducens]|uniref:DUF6312 domain-containing protein n=1 Tax=Marinivivus vitaminiproducens TaxID=3035935 RepID=UPI0027A756F3|nr:hypothetical protein P4R82_18840 [Geminicoccaceae bacterium SCSIO 64248]
MRQDIVGIHFQSEAFDLKDGLMALKMDSDVRRVTVVKPGESGGRSVYRRRDHDDDRQPIKRVTVIRKDERGRIVARDAYEGERKTKKQSRTLRPIEREVREILQFQANVIDNYLGRHRRSNEKRRDGWVRDMPDNVMRAVRKSRPKRLFRLNKLFRDRD